MEPEDDPMLGGAIVDRSLARMEVDRHRRLTRDAGDRAHVIHVSVREPYRVELGTVLSNGTEQPGGLLARIDQDRAAGRLIDHQIRVLLEGADSQGADDHTA
jgi:hypothetical protein